jgi:CBS domain-containing protein
MYEPTVTTVMTTEVVTAKPATPFKELVELLGSKGFSALAVVDDEGRPVGVVSEADLLPKEEFVGAEAPTLFANRARKHRWNQAQGVTAQEVMSTPVVTIAPDERVSTAARQLAESGMRRLFVIDSDGVLIGVVARRDLLSLFLRDDETVRQGVLDLVFHRVLLVDPATVEVHVDDGIVNVVGRLERRSETALAVRLIRAVPGVVDVADNLTYGWDDTVVPVDSGLRPRY